MVEPLDPPLNPAEILAAVGRLTQADITMFFTERGARPQCPSCAKNNWNVLDPTKDGVVHLNLQSAESAGNLVLGGTAVPAFLMLCQECGFIRQHAAMLMGEWKLRRERK